MTFLDIKELRLGMFEQPKTLEGHNPVIINLLLIKSCYQSQNAFLYELFKVEIDEKWETTE